MIARAGGRSCALPIALVIETMRPLPVSPIAGAPPAVLGVSMIRGAPTVVVAVARLLADHVPPPGRFVTVRIGADRTIALAFDAVIGIRTLARSELQPLPPLLGDAPAIGEVAALDAELVYALRAGQLVPDELVERVAREAEA